MLKKISLIVLVLLTQIGEAKQINETRISMNNHLSKTFTYEKIGEHAITEGDIILGNISEIQKPGAVIINDIKSRWANSVIPFEFSPLVSASMKAKIFYAFVHYQKMTSIRFVERTLINQTQYPDYVFFKPGSGCSSYVGKKGGEQPIILSSSCGYSAVIHEIGHALGLWHEQNRFDRNKYITIHFENIIPEHIHNFSQYPNFSTDFGPYNFKSIMHYSSYAFSKNGQKTITVIDNSSVIGQRNGLSPGDISAIEALYN